MAEGEAEPNPQLLQEAMAEFIADPSVETRARLLATLAGSYVWFPIPDDATAGLLSEPGWHTVGVTAELPLPTVTHADERFLVAFTSGEQLAIVLGDEQRFVAIAVSDLLTGIPEGHGIAIDHGTQSACTFAGDEVRALAQLVADIGAPILDGDQTTTDRTTTDRIAPTETVQLGAPVTEPVAALIGLRAAAEPNQALRALWRAVLFRPSRPNEGTQLVVLADVSPGLTSEEKEQIASRLIAAAAEIGTQLDVVFLDPEPPDEAFGAFARANAPFWSRA
jgi:hypothetical protein